MSLDSPSVPKIDGSGSHLAIVAARFNGTLVDALVTHTCETLAAAGATSPVIERTPGSNELPYAVSVLAGSGQFDGIIALGLVIAGATRHHHVIAESCASALHKISIERQLPVINGIIAVETRVQAEERAGKTINRGCEFALAALEMIQFSKQWKTGNPN